MKFIIILSGGVGNQLFQYAVGRSLAIRNNADLLIDNGSFELDTYYSRVFKLDRFSVPLKLRKSVFRSKIALCLLGVMNSNILLHRYIRQLTTFFFVCEKNVDQFHQSLDLALLNTNFKKNSFKVFCGYWQHPGYFNEIRDILLDEIVCISLSPKNQVLQEKIINTPNSVMVHIRLKHEISSSNTLIQNNDILNQEVLGNVLQPDYYTKAVNLLDSRLDNPTYFIFSDSPKFLNRYRNIFPSNSTIFLENDRGDDCEDIHLMSLCKNHVIANSSFSWWGAWLCKHVNPIIIAPKSSKYLPSIPNNWLRL